METNSGELDLKKRSFISIASLFFQSGYSAMLGLVANLILTILLSPSVFGIYITVLSLISFLNYFSDIGLSASLIQKKEITDEDCATTFTFQQVLTLILILLGILASDAIKNFYNLPPEGVFLYWSLLFGFFISSLKTIPSVFLERKIKFQKIVLVQIIENTVFYGTVCILAFLNFGLMSFTYAVLFRSVVGVIAIYILSPWMPRVSISRSRLKSLMNFGLPFQASSFLALFKDDLIILYLGKVLGFEGLGYIGWAKKWADAPLRIIMDNVSKVVFPLIARVQNDKAKIRRLAEKMLHYQTFILAPAYILAVIIMPTLVNIIPKYSKWAPAIPYFNLFCISSLIISFSAPFMNLFNAQGRVKLTLSFMIFFTALTWILTPTLIFYYGAIGFPIAHLFVSISFLAVLYKAKKDIGFSFFNFANSNIFQEIKSLYRNDR